MNFVKNDCPLNIGGLLQLAFGPSLAGLSEDQVEQLIRITEIIYEENSTTLSPGEVLYAIKEIGFFKIIKKNHHNSIK